MVFMPGGGSTGRRGNRVTLAQSITLFAVPAGVIAEGDLVRAEGDASADRGTDAYCASTTGASTTGASTTDANITGASTTETSATGANVAGRAALADSTGPEFLDTGSNDKNSTATNATARRADADELFRAVYPRLAGWLRRLVDDDDTAHEIAAEAFVRLLSRWTRVDNPQSYLYMIATNLVRDHWRKAERERRAIRNATAGVDADPMTHPGQDVDVRNLIESLPSRLRDPFLLHYYAGFAIREVATLLHRPEGTIKADLFAARARLKTALGERDG